MAQLLSSIMVTTATGLSVKFNRKGASTETKERKNVQSGGGGNNFDGYKLRDVENVR